MSTGTGLDAQVGYVVEGTYGTGATVTRFLPLVSETIAKKINPIESADILAGRQVMVTQQWGQGDAVIGGDVMHELYTESTGMIFRAAFGTVSTVAAGGTGVHTFFPAPPVVSLTAQVGRPTVYGTVIPHTYTGCKIDKFELGADAGKFFTWKMTLAAQEETVGTALATASYASNLRRWSFRHATLTVDGTTVPVKTFKLIGDNKLDLGRRFLGSTVISEPLRMDLATYTGQMNVEWGNPTAMGTLNYQRYLNGTESTLVAVMTAGTLCGTITANVRYDGSTPNVAGRGIIVQNVSYKCVAPTSSDSAALQIVITNDDTVA